MQTTSFTFKQPTDNLFYILVAVVFGITALYLMANIISANGLSFNTLITLIIPLVVAVPAYLFIATILVRNDYKRVDGQKVVRLDETNNTLQVTVPGKTFTITGADIKDVEAHKTWTILHLFVMPGYIKINLMNGHCFIITSLLATEDDLMVVLEGREMTETTRRANRLNTAQLTNCLC